MREVIRSIPSREVEAPFFGVLLNLGPQNSYVGSQWVGGNKLDDQVSFSAGAIFTGAAKGLQLSLAVDLDLFDFPSSGSNFSAYREVPYHVPVVAHMEAMEGQEKEVITWEKAKELGCRDFSIRVVVMPISTKETIVQVGAVPFGLAEMKEAYGEVFDKHFFPNTMVRVTRARTKLPEFMGGKTSSLVKKVEMVLEDTEAFGLGILPFSTCANPQGEVVKPATADIRRALFNHMHAAARPVAKTAAQMPSSLLMAERADKEPGNILPSLWSPWPALGPEAEDTAGARHEGMRLCFLGLAVGMLPGWGGGAICIARSWLGGTSEPELSRQPSNPYIYLGCKLAWAYVSKDKASIIEETRCGTCNN